MTIKAPKTLPLLAITLSRGDKWTFHAEYDTAEISVYATNHSALGYTNRGLIGRCADASEALDLALEFADELYQIDWEDHSDPEYVPADHDYRRNWIRLAMVPCHDPNIYSGSEWAGGQQGERA